MPNWQLSPHHTMRHSPLSSDCSVRQTAFFLLKHRSSDVKSAAHMYTWYKNPLYNKGILAAYKSAIAFMCSMLGEMLNPSRDSEHFPPITFVIHAVYQPTPPRLLSLPLSVFSPLTVYIMKMMFLHASYASAVTLFVSVLLKIKPPLN